MPLLTHSSLFVIGGCGIIILFPLVIQRKKTIPAVMWTVYLFDLVLLQPSFNFQLPKRRKFVRAANEMSENDSVIPSRIFRSTDGGHPLPCFQGALVILSHIHKRIIRNNNDHDLSRYVINIEQISSNKTDVLHFSIS